ncbi:MAG TPA: GNAT family N-acetyltransferase [Gemmataceae bacterium]|jgi:L-amino acid N-acyltransferase YncA|nr:GNAT family N-acetyltransferase [Gemmataceae bacterium]
MGSEAQEVIRPATAADWPAIWAMFQHVAAAGDAFAYDETTSEEVARKLWFDPPARAYVAVAGGQVLGTYYVRPNQPGRGDHVANGGYMVAAAARGRGLSSRMCGHSLETARALGFRGMQFNYVVSTNTAAVKTWLKHGFEVIGRIPNGYRHAELGEVEVLIMYRPL